ncbi:hypothetical protein BDV93DRAFT_518220 [Ceratobasidium sp. AG-I]|nr:hypothetical protein BDV93DRAFT_518220 [Ceratobasidium sp. AG-I]
MLSPRVRSPNLQSPSISRTAPMSPVAPKKFDSDQLRGYMKKLLASTLQGMVWDPKDRDKSKAWCKEIGERVKDRMLEIEPNGFKFVVTTQVNENLGQGGRAGLACHWEESDACAQEMFTNDSLICICIALAIRVS